MLKHPRLALCGFALAACDSLPKADRLDGPPSRTFESRKPVQAVASCLLAAWPRAAVTTGRDRFVVAQTALPGGAMQLKLQLGDALDRQAIIEPAGSGSRTRLWSLGMDFGSGTPAQVNAVQNCQ